MSMITPPAVAGQVAMQPGTDPPAQPSSAPLPTGPRNIFEAIIEVRRKVPYVQKRKPKEGSGIKYPYADIEGMLSALTQALNDAGIVIFPVEPSAIVSTEEITTKNGGSSTARCIKVTYRFVHAPTCTDMTVTAIGEANDSGDKSTPKCYTLALKQALRQTFLIETGDDDPDNHAPRERETNPVFLAAKDVLKAKHDDLATLEKHWKFTADKQANEVAFTMTQFAELENIYRSSKERLSRPAPARIQRPAGGPGNVPPVRNGNGAPARMPTRK